MSTHNTFRTWKVDRHSARVECSLKVLDEISTAALEGFRRFRHGGMEIGGILIGSREADAVRITEARPIDIEYGRGASFLLNDADDEVLQRLVRKTNEEGATRGVKVVGFYESHTRREISQSADLETYDRHFTAPGSVCIVLKPERGEATTSAVYIRNESGVAMPAISSGDVEIEGLTEPQEREPEPASRAQSEVETRVSEPIKDPPVKVSPPPVAQPRPTAYDRVQPAMLEQTPGRTRKWLLAIPAALLALLAVFFWMRPQTVQEPNRSRTETFPPKEAPAIPPRAPAAQTTEPVAKTPVNTATVKPPTKKRPAKRLRRGRARSRPSARPASVQP